MLMSVINPWEHFIFYSQSEYTALEFHLNPNRVKHIPSASEVRLYEHRNRINEYSSSIAPNNWEYYKKIVNPYELVYTKKKYKNFPDCISTIRPLSRSYFKMIEILKLIGFFGQSKRIRTAHVCEGPGGFIEALYTAAEKNKVHIDDSIAMTLQSTKNTIPGWRYAAHFLRTHNNIKIISGKDQTGDITKVDNQQFYIHSVDKQKCDIFTADGGFDFSSNYMKQEELVFPLLVASTKIGLEVLKPGGTFILKFIDFYNKATTDLLYFLSCHFVEWTLYKPAMSRPCNPEHYFIGKGFTRCIEDSLQAMYAWCNRFENNDIMESLLKTEYSPEFIQIINDIRDASAQSQIEYLTKVFDIIEQKDECIVQEYLTYNRESSYEWCKWFDVPT
jgi:23S rRNA U2552 (ribose-2'-O)-methylase RlmE/FtsJ